MTDIDKLTKSELRKLLKDEKKGKTGKKKKGKKKGGKRARLGQRGLENEKRK